MSIECKTMQLKDKKLDADSNRWLDPNIPEKEKYNLQEAVDETKFSETSQFWL